MGASMIAARCATSVSIMGQQEREQAPVSEVARLYRYKSLLVNRRAVPAA